MTRELRIINIKLLYQPLRRVKVTLSNGAIIYIEACYESWQQYGATERELWLTVPVAEKFNNWLHRKA